MLSANCKDPKIEAGKAVLFDDIALRAPRESWPRNSNDVRPASIRMDPPPSSAVTRGYPTTSGNNLLYG